MNVLLECITAHKTNGVLIYLELLYANVSVDMNYQMELVKVHIKNISCYLDAN